MFRPWQTIRSIPRLRQIFGVLARHGFGHITSNIHLPIATRLLNLFRRGEPPPALTQPERLRRVFEDLGPTFVKFGQLLASRPDILPAAYIAELSKLQDKADSLPFEALRQAIASELGAPPEQLFAEVEEEPLGSASVAQVHRAQLRNGVPVVVKIQRPGIERTVSQDLQLLHLLADILSDRRELASLDPVGMVRAFERAVWRELDFRHELRSLERIARNCTGHPIRIPKPYPEYSGRRVLTMEFVPGSSLKEASFSPEQGCALARELTRSLFDQIFLHGLFHADPHPGNLLLTPEGHLGLLDFGSVARLSPRSLTELLGFITAVVRRDYHRFARQILRAGYVSEQVDLGELAAELLDFLDPYYDMPLSDIDVGPLINDLFGILMRYRIRLPAQYVLLGRAIVTLEGTVRLLDPHFSVIEELKPQVRVLLLERWKPQNVLRDLTGEFSELAGCIRDFPATVADVMRRAREGSFTARIAVEDLRHLERRLERLNVQIPLGLFANALLLSGTILLILGPGSNMAVAAGVAAYVLSALLGLWFLRPHRR